MLTPAQLAPSHKMAKLSALTV